jgi:chaperonin GroES
MNIKPIRDLVVVSKEEGDKVSPGGLHLVATVDKMGSGVILAVGSGYVTESGTIVPLEVKVGDRVSFNRAMATELTVHGESYLLLREENVLCVTASA